MVIGAKPWLADVNNPLYEAGKAAVNRGEDHTFTVIKRTRGLCK